MTLWMVLAALAVVWVCVAYYLRGADLSAFDGDKHPAAAAHWQRFSASPENHDEQRAVLTSLQGINTVLRGTPRRKHLGLLRAYMDNLSADRELNAEFRSVDAGGVAAEWVLAPGADSARRTLYIHGGAWIMGSPRSHRVITAKFSEITGGAVLAIDYRLMPEHTRKDGIADCRNAYRWMLDHGPDGAVPAQVLFVAGDSAGGNLTLALIAWIRDQGLRQVNAAVALSPATDGTMGSPSLRANLHSDAMLGPLFGHLIRVPRSVLLWGGWLRTRIRPSHPDVSPVFGDLSGLPPVLIHASAAEMLLDDSVRYLNKARAAGSPVTLQTWGQMVHVWHIFYPAITQAREGFDEIAKFLAAAAPRS